MKRKITLTKRRCSKFPFDNNCGCPLWDAMSKAGFPVARIDTDIWTSLDGRRHEFEKPFNLSAYVKVLETGQPFSMMVSDE